MIRSLLAPALLLLVWAGPAAAGPMAPARSLAPIDVDQFRELYGQEALFRLRLGVEAAADGGAACTPAPPVWSQSSQFREYQRLLAAAQPYEAGRQLGVWQLWQQRCAGSAAMAVPAAAAAPGSSGASGAPPPQSGNAPGPNQERACNDFAATVKRLRIEARFTGRTERLLKIYNEKQERLKHKFGLDPCPQVAYPLPL